MEREFLLQVGKGIGVGVAAEGEEAVCAPEADLLGLRALASSSDFCAASKSRLSKAG